MPYLVRVRARVRVRVRGRVRVRVRVRGRVRVRVGLGLAAVEQHGVVTLVQDLVRVRVGLGVAIGLRLGLGLRLGRGFRSGSGRGSGYQPVDRLGLDEPPIRRGEGRAAERAVQALLVRVKVMGARVSVGGRAPSLVGVRRAGGGRVRLAG